VITGQCGPNAERVLRSSGIRIITGATGKVKDAIKQILNEAS
jgi:predicted Fe-Mo cluster-binding NifX family protein